MPSKKATPLPDTQEPPTEETAVKPGRKQRRTAHLVTTCESAIRSIDGGAWVLLEAQDAVANTILEPIIRAMREARTALVEGLSKVPPPTDEDDD